MVFQHFSLFEGLTVAENIALGISAKLAKHGLRERIVTVSTAYGLKLDPGRRVGELSVGERQRVEIVRCLLQEPKLLIMDEPTSVLTPQEIEVLFATLRRLVSEGCSILYISHKLEEIRALCDRATILRGGKVVGSCDPRQETARGLAEMMIGATLVPPQREAGTIGPVRLKVGGLTLASAEQFGVDLDDVSLEVKGGEILGIAGVAGNGQSELMDALIGEQLAATPEAIEIDGVPVGGLGPTAPACARHVLRAGGAPGSRLGARHVAVGERGADRQCAHEARQLRLHRRAERQGLRRQGGGRFRRAHARRRQRRAQPVGRQSAEVHHGPRDAAGARGADRGAADLGRRRRCGRHHPQVPAVAGPEPARPS